MLSTPLPIVTEVKPEHSEKARLFGVDFDHVFVKSEKADAKYSYKQAYGYFPGVVSINGIIAVSDELINIA